MSKTLFMVILCCYLYSNCAADYTPANCKEALRHGGRNGIYRIRLNELSQSFYVYCQADKAGGDAWTIIQRRQDGSIDFYRNWKDYQLGFGNLEGEFFIGLDKLNALTQNTLHELWIHLEDFEGGNRTAKYTSFAVGDESQAYALNVLGSYSGDAGNSLVAEAGMKFTTKDRQNDDNTDNCARLYFGAWWYKKCHASNLNGMYLKGEYPKDKFAQGVVWQTWRGYYYSLKYVTMAIRPVQ